MKTLKLVNNKLYLKLKKYDKNIEMVDPQLKNNAPAMLEGFSTNEGSKNKSAKRQRRNRGEC